MHKRLNLAGLKLRYVVYLVVERLIADSKPFSDKRDTVAGKRNPFFQLVRVCHNVPHLLVMSCRQKIYCRYHTPVLMHCQQKFCLNSKNIECAL